MKMKYVIGLAGQKQSGKNTVAKYINELIYEHTPKILTPSSVITCQLAYADPLKDTTIYFLKQVYGININYTDLEKIKEEPLIDNLDNEIKILKDSCFLDSGKKTATLRDFLQRMGTEFGRHSINPNIWVESCFNRICNNINNYNYFIITDTRFVNEIEYMKKHIHIISKVINIKYITVKVCKDTNNKDAHTSETSLDNYNFEYKILNFSNLNNLKKETKIFLKNIKILK